MRTKITLVLLFLNVALFFFIFHFERNWRTERASIEAKRRVFGPEAADIRHLEVSSPGSGLNYVLDRKGDTWSLTSPIQWPANPNAVSRIVYELQFLEHETSFSAQDLQKNGQSLADYGLEHPKMTISFSSGDPASTNAASQVVHLEVGDTTKVGSLLYVLSPDRSRIHVVSRTLADSVSVPLEDLRSDSIVTIPSFEARSLGIQSSGPSGIRVRLRREAGSRWAFETPLVARASKIATELAINSLDALQVRSFVTQNPPNPLPSASPLYRIALEGNNRQEILLIGSEVPQSSVTAGKEYYAQLEDKSAVFTVVVPPELASTLSNAQDSLRDRHVLDFDEQSVRSIVLAAPNQTYLTLQRLDDSAGWQIVRHSDSSQSLETIPADKAAVGRLLDQLSLLKAEDFKSDAPTAANIEAWGFNQPERRITLSFAGASGRAAASQPVTLEIGLASRNDPFAYARVVGPLSVYSVNPSILAESPVSTLAWRDRLLRQLPTSARITAISLTQIANSRVVYSRKLGPKETWEGVLAAEPDARRKAVLGILDDLRVLRAKKFVSDGFSETVQNAGGQDRPWMYRLDATISLPGGTGGEQVSSSTLWLLDRTGGSQQFAGSQEFGAVFEIEQPFLDALQALMYGPTDPGPVMPGKH